MLAALLTNWRLVLGVAVVFGLGLAAWRIDSRAYERGRASALAEQAAIIEGKTDAANALEDARRRCNLDPACRLQDDGYRRD